MFLMPKEILTLLVSMIPIGELRSSIPIAIGVYGLSPLSAFLFSVLGNILIASFLLLTLEPVAKFLDDHFYWLNRFFAWLFERTRKKHSHKFENWGALALITFVAIPLPMTGVWSGCLAAFVFGIPFKKSFPSVALGALIAGIVVTLVSLGAASLKHGLL